MEKPIAKKKLANLSSINKDNKEYCMNEDEDLLEKINLKNFHLKQYPNVRVQLESIFDTTIEIVDIYYICNGIIIYTKSKFKNFFNLFFYVYIEGCGHIYWVKIYI